MYFTKLLLYCAVPCRAAPRRAAPCRAVHYCAVLCCAVLCCAVLCCAVLCCAVLYCTVLYCTVLYCTVLYCTVRIVLLKTYFSNGSRRWVIVVDMLKAIFLPENPATFGSLHNLLEKIIPVLNPAGDSNRATG